MKKTQLVIDCGVGVSNNRFVCTTDFTTNFTFYWNSLEEYTLAFVEVKKKLMISAYKGLKDNKEITITLEDGRLIIEGINAQFFYLTIVHSETKELECQLNRH